MLNKKANFKLSRYQIWLLLLHVEEEISFLADLEVNHNTEDDLLVILQCLYEYFPENCDLRELYFWVDYDEEAIIHEE